jgi:hypothetical protein
MGANHVGSRGEATRRDEPLLKDKTEATSSSWFNEKEMWHGATAWRHRSEKRRHRRGEREETTVVGLTRNLLDWKMKKIHVVDSAATVEMVLWHFHRCRYMSSPLWFFCYGALVYWSLAMDECSGHEDLRGSGRRSVIPYVHRRTELYCSSLYAWAYLFVCP